MKKSLSLLLVIFLLFSFMFVAQAADKYELKEIKLTSKEVEIPSDFYWEYVKINDNKDGFTAIGRSYKCKEKDCNIYNISMDGVVTKANLQYDLDTDYDDGFIYNYYEYIDVDANNRLVKHEKKNPGYYDPNNGVPAVAETTTVLLDDNVYEEVYCDALNGADVPLKGMVGDRICLIKGKDSNNNDVYGLVKEGPNPKVIVKPSKDYTKFDHDNVDYTGFVSSSALYAGDDNYIFASSDGTTQTINSFDIMTYSGVFRANVVANTKYGLVFGSEANADIYGDFYKDKIFYDIPKASDEEWPSFAHFNKPSSFIALSNGEFYVAEGQDADYCLANGGCHDAEVKLYDSKRNLVTDYTNIQNIDNNTPVISYTKDNKVYFTDGKEILYTMDNPNNKYEWLFSFIVEDNGTYYFKSGTTIGGESNNCLYILSKVKEESKEETTPAKDVVKYEVLDGNNQTFDVSGKALLKFRFSIPFGDFKASGKVYFDGKLVDPKYYDATEGSTIITFKNAFTKDIKDGDHTVKVVTDLGEVTANFKTIGNPGTLDKVFTMGGLLAISLVGVYVTCVRIKKFD